LVAPAGYHTLVTCGARISLIVSGDAPPYRPSADLLLTSLALAAGPRAVAVVLSGYGNDGATGATGATAIHHHGGAVIASNQATSTVSVMPSATINRDEIIDYVVSVDEIPALLVRLASFAVESPARSATVMELPTQSGSSDWGTRAHRERSSQVNGENAQPSGIEKPGWIGHRRRGLPAGGRRQREA
jgi:two-component system chemotaxis response regulator CheB